jgi:hypothetical protein
MSCGRGCSWVSVDGLQALESAIQAGRPILRHTIRGAGRSGHPPLQDFLQVKVGAKALDIGEDSRPCKS